MKYAIMGLFSIVLIAVVTPTIAGTQGDSPDIPKLLPQDMYAFWDVAFNDVIVESPFVLQKPTPKGHIPLLDETRLKQEYPWFYKYLYRPDGLPHYMVINKWVKPIKISTGWPNDLMPFDPILKDGEPINDYKLYDYSSGDSEALAIVENELSSLIPMLSELTKLDINYLPRTNETSEEYGNIRIVFTKEMPQHDPANKLGIGKWHHVFSTSYTTPMFPKKIAFRGAIEPSFSGMNIFAPEAEKQVEGYFLTDENNQIEFGVCYLWDGHAEEMLRALIQECMVRNLGFPGLGTRHNMIGGIMGDWSKSEGIPAITDYDKRIISGMYRDELKAGMSAIKMQRALKDNN